MKVGTEQEWQEARQALLVAERELEGRAKSVEEQRRELPWVPVEKEYAFATEEGPKTLPELFEGRSRLLIYHFMFGEDWETACPGAGPRVGGVRERGLERVRDARRHRLQHLPRVSAFAHREAPVLRPTRTAADELTSQHVPGGQRGRRRGRRAVCPAMPADPM